MKILILDQAAVRYHNYLEARLRELHPQDSIVFCDDPAKASHEHCTVLLAQPDWAAAYIKDRVTRSAALPAWIQSTWAGVTPLMESVRTTGIPLTGIKEIFGPMITEYVMGHILADSQRHQRFRANQSRNLWQPVWPGRLAGKKMVILGTGSIGSHLAGVASTGFSMLVSGISRQGKMAPGFDEVVSIAGASSVLRDTDYLVMTLPDTPETKDLVNAAVLAQLPAHAMLINVGRGSTLVDADLLAGIDSGSLRHAVLDVFEKEPLAPDHPFWQHEQITVTPHIAAVSHPEDISRIFLENLSRYRSGQSLKFLVDPAKGY